MRTRTPWLGITAFAVLLLTVLPFIVIIPSSFTAGNFLAFPPEGFSLRWYEQILQRPEFIDAFFFSLQLAAATAVIATALGTLAGIALAKYQFRGKAAINSFMLSPLVLPALLIGIALLVFFAFLGVAGTFIALLLGHLVITIPYVVRLVLTGLAGYDYTLDKAAAIMGASPPRVFWTVTVPLIRPAVMSGMIFAFLLSFDNVTVSLFLVSPIQTTLPLQIFNYVQDSLDPLIAAVSTVVIVLSLIPVLLIERFYGLARLFGLPANDE